MVLLVGIIIAIFSFFLFSNEANVPNLDSVKVAVINAEKLKSSAKCFKVHEKVAVMLTEVISRMKVSESNIKAEFEAIKENSALNDKQKKVKISNLENEWKDISAKYNTEIQNIKNIDLKLSEYLGNKLNKIIAQISKSLKISIVLNKETKDSIIVFYNSDGIDITNLVIAKLNQKVPTVDLKEISND
jgi:Skp family chaperone for outer membrane proteins